MKQGNPSTQKVVLDSENPVAETLLIPLHARAVEARRPDPMVRDNRAVMMMEQIDYDFGRFKLASHDQITMMMRVREFDRLVREFLGRYPAGTVVHIGCGLDTRFERLDNGQVLWYDLDLPEVIAVRRQLIPESERCQYVGCSVLDKSWLDLVDVEAGQPVLFVAEAVFPYFEEVQVRSLFLILMDRFPGSELVGAQARPRPGNMVQRHPAVGGMVLFRPARTPPWLDGVDALLPALRERRRHLPLPARPAQLRGRGEDPDT
jgi:O-methyltransferase involved in polyketide biosynthesis